MMLEENLEVQNNPTASDMERLFHAMEELGNANFDPIDREQFDDPTIADHFNAMLEKEVSRNNRYLARINDAQLRIGDTSCLKSMFERITAQQAAIEQLQEFRKGITTDDRPVEATNEEFLALAMEIRNSLGPCANEIQQTIDALESVGANWKADPLSEATAEATPEQWSLRTAYENTLRSYGRLLALQTRTQSMITDAEALFSHVDNSSHTNEGFLSGVDSLTESYRSLSAECLDTGRHLYRISRDIDNARNDMFRHFSKPTLHDRLRVYETDHVTLAWRLYNNIVEFESLKLTQVNNTTSCKLGLWLASVTDPLLTEAESFQKLAQAHQQLHDACVECFMAKQNYNLALALEKFDVVRQTLKVFQDAMDELHIYLHSIGITDETDVWKFRG